MIKILAAGALAAVGAWTARALWVALGDAFAADAARASAVPPCRSTS